MESKRSIEPSIIEEVVQEYPRYGDEEEMEELSLGINIENELELAHGSKELIKASLFSILKEDHEKIRTSSPPKKGPKVQEGNRIVSQVLSRDKDLFL
jgi:hypothetical protein